MRVTYRQVSTINCRPGTLLPYLPRIVPGTRYVVYIMLASGVWLHPRPSSWGPRDTLSTPQPRSEPKPTCWGAVCVGADWSLSSLPPTPTATSQQKKTKQTENNVRIYSIEVNNNSTKGRPFWQICGYRDDGKANCIRMYCCAGN